MQRTSVMAAAVTDNQSLEAIEKKSQELIALGKAQEAIDLLDRVSEDLSGYPGLYRLKGVARLLQGSNTEARMIFEEVEGTFGDDPLFLNMFGVALRRERDLGRAREIYQRALEIQPDEPALLSNYGNLLIDLGQLDDARQQLEKALALAPAHRDARQNLARLEQQLGGVSDSMTGPIPGTASAIVSPPAVSDAEKDEAAADWLKLAALAQRDGNQEEAISFARKAIEIKPDLAPAYKLAGEVMAALGRFDQAEQALLYGILLGDPDAHSLTNLGGVCASRGQVSLARILLNKVLAMQPQHKVARQNLDLINKRQVSGSESDRPLF